MPLCDLFCCNQFPSSPLKKDVVEGFTGHSDSLFLGVDFLEKRFVGLESLRERSLAQDMTILS